MVKRRVEISEPEVQSSPSSKSPRISLNFPQKLYSIVSSKNGPIKWYENTINTIDINLSALLNYLHNENESFSLWDFLRQLKWYGFKQLPSKTSDSIRFHNEYFVKGKPEQLNNIRFHVTNDEEEMALVDAHKTKALLNDHRRRTDKCRMNVTKPIDSSALLDVKMKATAKMFQLDTELGKERAVIPRDLYKEPENCSSNQMQMDYAGYYGAVSDDDIKGFFGSYLPIYSLEPDPVEMVPNNGEGNFRTHKKASGTANSKLVVGYEPGCQEAASTSVVPIPFAIKKAMSVSQQIHPILKENNSRMTLRSLTKNARLKESSGMVVEKFQSCKKMAEIKTEEQEAGGNTSDDNDSETVILPDMPSLEI